MNGVFYCLDDHEVIQIGIRESLRLLFPAWRVQTFSSCSAFREAPKSDMLSILIADFYLPDGCGAEVARDWKHGFPNRRTVLFSHRSTKDLKKEMSDYQLDIVVSKSEPLDFLGRQIRNLLEKDFPEVAKENQEKGNPLTKSEIAILQLICKGYSQKEIAQRMDIELRTVETHRTNMNRKIGKKNIAELIQYAISQGIYDLDKQSE